jgi:succinate dehydrogenase / fumarate reductase flavoprotein subunit
LKKAIDAFPSLWERYGKVRVEGSRTYNPGWHLYWDLRNMLLIAETVARAAVQREESRGAHTRLDFPDTDNDRWVTINSSAKWVNGVVQVSTTPKPRMPDDLKAIVDGR